MRECASIGCDRGGVSKEDAQLDSLWKSIAPSEESVGAHSSKAVDCRLECQGSLK